jgi:hypothetical protein
VLKKYLGMGCYRLSVEGPWESPEAHKLFIGNY